MLHKKLCQSNCLWMSSSFSRAMLFPLEPYWIIIKKLSKVSYCFYGFAHDYQLSLVFWIFLFIDLGYFKHCWTTQYFNLSFNMSSSHETNIFLTFTWVYTVVVFVQWACKLQLNINAMWAVEENLGCYRVHYSNMVYSNIVCHVLIVDMKNT